MKETGKRFFKKAALVPVMLGNRLFFSIYFRLARQSYRLRPLEDLHHKRILLLAPHVDDEVIGCGGLLFKLAAANNTVQCLYLTNGAGSFHPALSREELIELRKKEALRVAEFYGLAPPVFLGMEDGALEVTAAAIEMVEKELRRFAPQIVFLPYFLDGHGDHVATARLGLAALEKGGFAADFPLYLYQACSSFTPGDANRYFLLAEEYEGKKKALQIFRSQTMPFGGLLMLDRYRRWAVGGKKGAAAKIKGAEFFRKDSLEGLKKALAHLSNDITAKIRPISSPYFLIRDYFSGWQAKKGLAKLWPVSGMRGRSAGVLVENKSNDDPEKHDYLGHVEDMLHQALGQKGSRGRK